MSTSQCIGWLTWDPSRIAFTVPLIDRPVYWYGILFVTGFLLGYLMFIPLLARFISQVKLISKLEAKLKARALADRLCWYIIIGTIVGARLGEVVFYDWPRYQNHLFDIFKIWQGGLSSHGGTLGVFLALFLFIKRTRKELPELSFLALLDIVAVPSALAACFIRLGNFINQEILGTETTMPWGLIFGHPLDGSIPSPRHPVQLYEAIAYLCTFFILLIVWKREKQHEFPGKIIGLLFMLIFGFRFILEFWKADQTSILSSDFLQMGQLLSLPFFALGLILFLQSSNFSCNKRCER